MFKKRTITVCTTKDDYVMIRDIIDERVNTIGYRHIYSNDSNDYISFTTRTSVKYVANIIAIVANRKANVVGDTIVIVKE